MSHSVSPLVVAKFGGTSVANFDAMNHSADVVLSDASVRLVVLSASAGVTNLLVALAEGLEATERFVKLDAIRKIQFDILERLANPNVIREEIERLLENITTLAEAASLATSNALTDELVSHGELMSTLLFVEILRERNVQAQWFDVRKVMRTSDRFGRAEPDVAALQNWRLSSLPRVWPTASLLRRALLAVKRKAAPPRWDVAAATTPPRCSAKRCMRPASISGPMSPAFTPPTRAWCLPPNALTRLPLKKRLKWRPSARKFCIRQPCCLPFVAISRSLSAPAKIPKPAAHWCATKPATRRCSARWRYVANRPC
jgi:hypothetical protein